MALLASQFLAFSVSPSFAATNVTATGTNPAYCNQTAGFPNSVTAVRLAGGDCLIKFIGDSTWTVPAGTTSVRFLLVGGGAAGMGDGGGGGGGGGGLTATGRPVTPGTVVSVDVGAGGSGDSQGVGSDSRVDLDGDATFEWVAKGGTTGGGCTSSTGGTGGQTVPHTNATNLTGGNGGNGPTGCAQGTAATNTGLGNGFTSDITGSTFYYGGGGGGGIGAFSWDGSIYIGSTATLGLAAGGFGGGGAGAKQLSISDRNISTQVSSGYLTNGTNSVSTVTLTARCSSGANHPYVTRGFPGLNGYGGGGGGGTSYGDGCSAGTNDDGERNAGGSGGDGVVFIRYAAETTAPSIVSGATSNFAENTATTTNAATVTLSESSTITLISSSDSDSFTITIVDSVSANLRFKAPPNFESPRDGNGDNAYVVVIQAIDLAGNSANLTVTITVTNVNEAPTITNSNSDPTYAISQGENSTSIVDLDGSDVDASTTLSWSISGTDSTKFAINSTSGLLTFVTAPNFESATDADTNNSYIVIATLSDGTLTDTQTITVSITNVNEAPTIGSFGGAATASYSKSEGSASLFNMNATDVDAGTTLTYSLSGTDSTRFSINALGNLSFTAAPDFESAQDADQNNDYIVIVQVSDGTLTDTQTLTISVTNTNEAPTITINASGTTHAISISENSTSVITYTGTDVDAGATLTWSISGTDSSFFVIDTNTGVLTFASAPDFENALDSGNNNTYVVIVAISDGALSDAQTLTVTITNVNESGSISAPSVSGTAYKGVAITITVTTNSPGKVRFLVGGKRISNCLARSTTGNYPSFTATCTWKPSIHGPQQVSAQLTPSNVTFTSATSAKSVIWVFRRTGSR